MTSLYIGLYSQNKIKLFLLFFFLLLLFYKHAEGKELIRVAILTKQKSAAISYKKGLIIKTSSGKRILIRKVNPLIISICNKGILIHRKCIRGDRVMVMPVKGKLTIKDKKYGGIFDIIKTGRRLLIINRIEIEEYLKGVVPMEMPSSWNMEALKAQSVIARTYALYQKKANKERRFDLVSTTGDQVYGGKNGETVRTNKAVSDTKGLILTYNGGIILSVYHSTSAGPTEDAEEIWSKNLPYLKGVSCPFDKESPFYSWDKIIRIEDVEDRLKRIYPMGTIASITPYLRSKMGRIMGIRIIHSKGELFLKGGEFRRIVGNTFLPSTKFEIVEMNDDIHLSGHGAGHGLGLCQWGAKGMADLGYRFNEILKHYYPGTKIVRRRRR